MDFVRAKEEKKLEHFLFFFLLTSKKMRERKKVRSNVYSAPEAKRQSLRAQGFTVKEIFFLGPNSKIPISHNNFSDAFRFSENGHRKWTQTNGEIRTKHEIGKRERERERERKSKNERWFWLVP